MSRLLLVSNRLPVTLRRENGSLSVAASSGGVATGLSGLHERLDAVWIGWSGEDSRRTIDMDRSIEQLLTPRRLVSVPLSSEEVATFYGRIANGVLWPIFHDLLEHLPYVTEGWDVYEAVNARFADVVASQYRAGDLIWVHDYQLLRLPALLRSRLPDARIGFFLHIPFPNPEIFFALPCRRWLIEGMLGADVIGFHTRRFRGHFTAALRRLFGIEMIDEAVEYGGRSVHPGIFPMGIDAAACAQRAGTRAVGAELARLRSGDNVRLLVGVDRLDYSKGLPRRLLALERLLTKYPEWRERVRLVQIAVPSREGVAAYRRVRRTVEKLVGSINGRFGTPRWTPIHYIYRGVSPQLLSALYRAADVLLVTPLRDGMNLVAKEFVAARTDDDGVLVLSEFAGAVDELTQALVVNPYDVDGVAEAIHRALTMTREERARRMHTLRDHVMTHDVTAWAERFLGALRPVEAASSS